MGNRIGFAPNEIHHLYNRGTDKRKIFNTRADYERFIALLYLCNSPLPVKFENLRRGERGRTLLVQALMTDRDDPLVDILAYCLMPNHVHLLVKEKTEGNISRFMQKLMTAYTMYFNMRYDRTGSLMQGKFRASHADTDRYFKYLFSYIHLNPVKLIEPTWKESHIKNKKRAKQYLAEYPYSSYIDYSVGRRPESVIINKDAALEYFDRVTDFETNVEDWLEYKKD